MSYFNSVNTVESSTEMYTTYLMNTTISCAETEIAGTEDTSLVYTEACESDLTKSGVSSTYAYIIGALLALSAYANTLIPVLYIHNSQCISMKLRAAISSIIYRKVCPHT